MRAFVCKSVNIPDVWKADLCSLLWRKLFDVELYIYQRCLEVSLMGLCHEEGLTVSFLSHCHGHLADIFLYACLQAASRVFVYTHASRVTGCAHRLVNFHSFVRLNLSWWPASVNMCIQRLCDGKLKTNRTEEQKCVSCSVSWEACWMLAGISACLANNTLLIVRNIMANNNFV